METHFYFCIDIFLVFKTVLGPNNTLIPLFFISCALLINSLAVIMSNHSIFSLLFLIFNFILAAIVLFLLECEVLALLFVVVYVGAVAIGRHFNVYYPAYLMQIVQEQIVITNLILVFVLGLVLTACNVLLFSFRDRLTNPILCQNLTNG